MPSITSHQGFVQLLLVILLALTAGCLGDAERGNPLDPLSGNYNESGAVAGTVTTFFAPFEGIGGVRVRLLSLSNADERVGITTSSGRFSITDVPPGRYEITTNLDGYASTVDSLMVEVGRLVEVTLPINGIPAIQIVTIHTENLNRWFPQDPLFQLVVEVFISDPDGVGDIQEVRLSAPSIDYSDTLRVTSGEPGVYGRVFSEQELPVPAQGLLGLPFQVEATDSQGVQGSTNTVQIVRIVASFPSDDVRPREGEIVGPQPTFVWRTTALPYRFTHRVDISSVPVPGQEIPLFRYSEIASVDTTFTIPDALPPGTYSWMVSVVDDFGNLSRSRPQSFNATPAP